MSVRPFIPAMSMRNTILKWLPALLAAAGTVASLILWSALTAQENAQIARMVQLKTAAIGDMIRHGMEARVQGLDRMVKRWEIGGRPVQRGWESDAGLYVKHYRGYQVIAWADTASRVRWVVPRAESAAYRGRPFMAEEAPKAALLAAQKRRVPVFTRTLDLGRDAKGFFAALPIYSAKGFDGFIVAAFKSRELFDDLLHEEAEHEGYAIAVFGGPEKLYDSGGATGPQELKWMQETELGLYGVTWHVRVWPRSDHLKLLQSPLPGVTLVMGLMMALLLALSVYFAQAAWRREKEVEAANRALQRENAERRRAEETVARHAQELERSNAELQQFAYVASHDLQEPLRIISGYVQLLARRYRGKLDAEADEFIAFAADGASRMQALIGDLLTYSRVETRARAFEPVDCEQILEQALASLKLAIEESGAVVTHTALPVLLADAGQLHQLFLNLIGNAIKYRSAAPPVVHVAAEEQPGEWLFSVRDNGIGLDPKYSERIFVIFQRLHGRGEYPGTGIGLAICKKVVENHGGCIWVESQPGKGATFYFTIKKALPT
jgi:signal transduction histidine kinase